MTLVELREETERGIFGYEIQFIIQIKQFSANIAVITRNTPFA